MYVCIPLYHNIVCTNVQTGRNFGRTSISVPSTPNLEEEPVPPFPRDRRQCSGGILNSVAGGGSPVAQNSPPEVSNRFREP